MQNSFASNEFNKLKNLLRSAFLSGGCTIFAACFFIDVAGAVVLSHEGNVHAKQPTIPAGSHSRTKADKSSFDAKFEKIRSLIEKDDKLRRQIKKSAANFGINPIHIVGALAGEHTYNVDALDYFQTYFVKAASYLNSAIEFRYKGELVTSFVKRPQFAACEQFQTSYELWDCREEIWITKFAGKTVDGKSFPRDRFSKIFFQPLYAGQTFGLGQLNPLTALRVSDTVSKTTGRKKLTATNAPKVYEAIMAPDSTIDYMAGVIKLSIDAYRRHAGVDISNNPGLTATLYNLGDVIDRAKKLGKKRKADAAIMPEENYYGWLVNDRLDELNKLIR